MAKVIFGVSPTSVILRAKLKDSSATDGRGLTGLSFSATGLTISVIKNNAISGTPYTAAGGTIESIATLGTYAAPTATKCRFKEIDSTYHKGLYEFQFSDTVFSATDSVIISIAGASALSEADFEIQCKNLNSNLKAIDEQTTNGNNATLNLKKFSIVNDSGNAVDIQATASGYGIYSSGETAGVKFEGTTDGQGFIIVGNGIGNALTVNSTSGDGANIRSDNGIGMKLVGDANDISAREIDAIEIKTGQMQFSADGVNIYDIMSNLLAMANGKFIKYGNVITFYRQDNSTPAFTVTVTDSERTRS